MTNSFCALVGIERPLQQASMTRVATPALVSAVSNAGALGMIAVGRSPADAVRAQIDSVRAQTNRPFGAGFIVPYLDRATFEFVASELSIVEFFYGWPDASLVRPDIITGWQVGTVDEARAAVDAGCSFVIAQGVEAGGHVRSTVPLNLLLDQVCSAVEVPVVAAGGIGTNADVKAAMAMGADAVRVGTRLLGAIETDVHPIYRELLLGAQADDAQYTTIFDVGWPDAPQRVLASAVTAAMANGPDPAAHNGTNAIPRRGTTPPTSATVGQIEALALYAGRSVGALTAVTSARAIIDELLNDQH